MVIGIVIIAVIVIFYILSYALNEKTSVPEGCEDLGDLTSCDSCSLGGCSVRKVKDDVNAHVK